VLGTKRRINTLHGQAPIAFAPDAKPTAIFGAESAEFRMLSLMSNRGNVTIGFFIN
jgi:hypothetical protein